MNVFYVIFSYLIIFKTNGIAVLTKFKGCQKHDQHETMSRFSYKINNISKDKKNFIFEPSSIYSCVRKLNIRITFENRKQIAGDDYFTINEAEDILTGKSSVLMHPVVVKVHREETQLVYPISAASSHCLQHSDAWYSVCNFVQPHMLQEISLQVLQKIPSCDEKTTWIDLTRGQKLRLGTNYPEAYDALPSIVVSYSTLMKLSELCRNQSCPVDPDRYWLLFPTIETEKVMPECIVVSKDDVTLDGKSLDDLSASLDNILHSTDRCQQNIQTCINNQPLTLRSGENNQYYLENIQLKIVEPLPSASALTGGDFVALEYTNPFLSFIDIDVRDDSNALIRKGLNIETQSIVSDSTAADHTIVESIIINVGFVEEHFQPSLINCSAPLPQTISIKGPSSAISPMSSHLFRMTIEGKFLNETMTCDFEILNAAGIKAGSRSVTFRKLRRCVCAFHKACSCVDSKVKLQSDFLSAEEYKAAGYHHDLPVQPVIVLEYFKIDPVNIILIACTILLLAGKMKILLGMCISAVRYFGLHYIRQQINCCTLPIMSVSNETLALQRTGMDVVINMFFFVVFPIAIIWNVACWLWGVASSFKSTCCRIKRRTNVDQFIKSKEQRLDLKVDGRYEREAEDTQYVRNALNTLSRATAKDSNSRRKPPI